jgi:hypothetical protein
MRLKGRCNKVDGVPKHIVPAKPYLVKQKMVKVKGGEHCQPIVGTNGAEEIAEFF